MHVWCTHVFVLQVCASVSALLPGSCRLQTNDNFFQDSAIAKQSR